MGLTLYNLMADVRVKSAAVRSSISAERPGHTVAAGTSRWMNRSLTTVLITSKFQQFISPDPLVCIPGSAGSWRDRAESHKVIVLSFGGFPNSYSQHISNYKWHSVHKLGEVFANISLDVNIAEHSWGKGRYVFYVGLTNKHIPCIHM